jgi:3-oxoacyl-[acyl-carrier-protein] synthase-3
MKKIGISSIGAFVPEHKLTNFDLEKIVDTTDGWIVQRTGIRERRIAPEGMNPSDMAYEAAKKCLEGQDLKPELFIASCESAETILPYQASIIGKKLNLGNLPAFDINAACSGLVYGIALASSMMQTYGYKTGLVTAGEKMSAFTNYKDRQSCILFGDGASALLLSSENVEHEIVAVEIGCDTSGSDHVKMGARTGDPFFWQDGKRVFKFAIETISRLIDTLKEKAGLKDTDSFYVVPHQANLRMMQAVAENKNIPMERFVMNIERLGNTASASIGLALEEAWMAGRFKKGDNIFLIGFGGGLSWGGAVLKW